jgi:sugar phosphate isomerase/epimerase
MQTRLGVNLGFATNRYPEPEEWSRIVGEELGLRTVMFSADLLSMFYPSELIAEEVARINALAARYHFAVESIFTAAFTRVNHVCHPNPRMREEWVQFLIRLAQTGARLGATMMGSHFGILSMRDYLDEKRREAMTEVAIGNWGRIAVAAKEAGIECLLFEPMSVPREFAQTIPETHRLLERLNRELVLPMRLCLDVDHGDVASPDPRDSDPYAWLEEFAAVSPVVHIKQSNRDKSGHWPFTADKNKLGIIRPEKVLRALESGGAQNVTLILECNWRERTPSDYRVVSDLKESVAYWREYVRD